MYFHAAFQPFSASSLLRAWRATPLDATAAQGKAIFDSQRCSGCHGESGIGAVGPSLTHISSQYQPAQLTALLKAPTAKMRAAGMTPLTLSPADMTALRFLPDQPRGNLGRRRWRRHPIPGCPRQHRQEGNRPDRGNAERSGRSFCGIGHDRYQQYRQGNAWGEDLSVPWLCGLPRSGRRGDAAGTCFDGCWSSAHGRSGRGPAPQSVNQDEGRRHASGHGRRRSAGIACGIHKRSGFNRRCLREERGSRRGDTARRPTSANSHRIGKGGRGYDSVTSSIARRDRSRRR